MAREAAVVRVWDLPTRLFHWALAFGVVAAIVSARLGGAAMTWHMRFGYAIFTLLAFRLAWGFVGGHWSRFRSFVTGPATMLRYLRGQSLPREHHDVGHTPLGAWSVLALLVVLVAQVATGLVADDEIANNGPLFKYVGDATSAAASHWHRLTASGSSSAWRCSTSARSPSAGCAGARTWCAHAARRQGALRRRPGRARRPRVATTGAGADRRLRHRRRADRATRRLKPTTPGMRAKAKGPRIELRRPRTGDELKRTAEIFREYAASLDVDLCFQNFEAELTGLPGEYAAPGGHLLLAFVDRELAGCGALRPYRDADHGNACEMKRLYVRPRFRRFGLGRILAQALLDEARAPAIRRCCSTPSTTWSRRASSTPRSASSRSRPTISTRSPALTT